MRLFWLIFSHCDKKKGGFTSEADDDVAAPTVMAIFFKDFPCLKTSKPSCIEKFEALRTNQVEALHSTSLLKMPLVNFLNEELLTLHVILTDHFNQKFARKFSQVEIEGISIRLLLAKKSKKKSRGH